MKRIFDKLLDYDLNPYFIGQHEGLCEDRFVVIKSAGQIPSIYTNRLGQSIIDIIVFTPLDNYIDIDPYIKEIKGALKEIKDIRYTGNETPVITDDEKKAYTTSIQYAVYKKLEG